MCCPLAAGRMSRPRTCSDLAVKASVSNYVTDLCVDDRIGRMFHMSENANGNSGVNGNIEGNYSFMTCIKIL